MGDRTGIEYLRDRNGVPGATWNPTLGCSKVSEGCENCWARSVAKTRLKTSFAPTCYPERLKIPLSWRRPRNIAVSFMGDLFHEEIPFEFIAAVYGVMAEAQRHTFVVCTKRPELAREVLEWLVREETMTERRGGPSIRVPEYRARHRCAREWAKRGGDVTSHWVTAEGLVHTEAKPGSGIWPLPNVVFLFSAENQARFDERVGDALAVPAVCHGVSLEPLLGPVDLDRGNACFDREKAVKHMMHGPACLNRDQAEDYIARVGLGFVAVGCESGPHRRESHPQWFADIRDQCAAAGVPFFLKQMQGADTNLTVHKLPLLDGRQWTERPEMML